MWGLEHLLLFGLPKNKLELTKGKSRCVFPFLTREESEAHFCAWTDTLARWKGLPARVSPDDWRAAVGDWQVRLRGRPIEALVPFHFEDFRTFHGVFWQRDLWPGQPEGREAGWDDIQRHFDVQLQLWRLFGDFCARHGGSHAGRCDVLLSDRAAVAPDQFYYSARRSEVLFEDAFFQGAPDLIVEVLSPATRAIDRGPRRELYRRHEVRHLWLLDPEVETVEVFELEGGAYQQRRAVGAGESFAHVLFPGESIAVDFLFDTQWKRKGFWTVPSEPKPVPAWLVPPERRLGLEHLFLMGHPERRYEIWGTRAPCVLPFGSDEEARVRFGHFLEEAARWEQAPVPAASSLTADIEQAEVGRFQLTREGRHVWLHVAVDAREYRTLAAVWNRHESWAWGE